MQNWHKPKLSLVLWIVAAAWCGVLFYFSGQNSVESGDLSLRFTRWVLRTFPFLPWSVKQLEPVLRKCAHFGIFAVEGALLGAAMMTSLRPRMGGTLAILSCAAIAVLNEFHQSFSEGRSCEFSDMLIDSAGGLTGALFAAFALWLLFRISCRTAPREGNVII